MKILQLRIPKFRLGRAGMAGLVLVSTALLARATDASSLVAKLQNTGADADASGSVVAALNPQSAYLIVRASKLAPGTRYYLTVNGQSHASFVTDSRGTGQVWFTNPQAAYRRLLDFDPRGRLLGIADGTNTVLQAVLSGAGEPEASTVLERSDLRRVSASLRKSATAQYVMSGGERRFSVTLMNVAGTNWWVYVDGVPRGPLRVTQGVGRARFTSNPKLSSDKLLEFDPRSQVIDVAQGTNLMFSGKLKGRARNISFASPSVRPGVIPSTQLDPDGIARARTRVNKDASRHFSVELENVPIGAYDLLVNGKPAAVINVVATESGDEGEAEFAANSDDLNKLPLTFDPATAVFAVQQGDNVFFAGKIGRSIPGAAGGTDPVQIEESLTSAGLDMDASGHAKYEIRDDGRVRFSVEIEDVPAGPYELWVDGILRGRWRAALSGDRVQGEVEFASRGDDAGKLPLQFDPRGKPLQVRSAAGIFFSHLFGAGDGAGGSAAPLTIGLPLFVAEASAGKAEAQYERDDRGHRKFEVELEDVPAGDYTLLVGGVPQGTIPVATINDRTRGKLEFEDEPSAGELELTFDPLGQTVAVLRDGAIWFQRDFPSQ